MNHFPSLLEREIKNILCNNKSILGMKKIHKKQKIKIYNTINVYNNTARYNKLKGETDCRRKLKKTL